jgi:hypothetical protein
MRQPGSPRSQSRSKANGSWQDAYWWQRHGHHEIFDVIHEIVLPAEFDKPDDQAKKDVSIVDGKHGSARQHHHPNLASGSREGNHRPPATR